MREPEIDVTMMRGGGGGEGDGCATKMSFGRPLPFCRCDAVSAAPQSYPPKGPKMRRDALLFDCTGGEVDKIELIFHFRAYRSPLDFLANAMESPWQLSGNVLMLPLELIWSSFRSMST